MKNKILILLVLFIASIGSANAQKYFLRSNGQTTPVDPHLGTTLSFKIPVLLDTTHALTAAGIDSCGIIFKEFLSSKFWIRDTILTGGHKWTLIQSSGVDSSSKWGFITGLLTSQTDLNNALNGKQATIALGTTSQYFRGDLSLATFPTNISSFTNDANYLTSVLDTNSITGTGIAGSKLQLRGDVASPGANKVYGTNSGGTPGWYPAASGSGSVTSIATNAPITGGTITSTGTIGVDTTTTTTGLATLYQSGLKLNKTDTAAMLAPYVKSNTVVLYTDTARLLGDFIRRIDTATTTTTPPSGPGARFMWLPLSVAFRAGYAGTTTWDPANIGTGSVAFGTANEAKGQYSTAFGNNSIATGNYSVAMGNSNTASATSAIAIGAGCIATAADAIAMGASNISSGQGSFTVGTSNTTSGQYSATFGGSNFNLGDYSTVFGFANAATGLNSVVFGNQSKATNTATVAIGRDIISKDSFELAIGRWNDTTSLTTILAIGYGQDNTHRLNIFSVDTLGNARARTTLANDSSNILATTAWVKQQHYGSGGGGGGGTVTAISTTNGILGGTVTSTGTLQADTSLLATQFDVGLKLNKTDTASMLSPYARIAQLPVDTFFVKNKGTAGLTFGYSTGTDTLNLPNLVQGSNITLTKNSDSSITISSSAIPSTPPIDSVLRVGNITTRNMSIGNLTMIGTNSSTDTLKMKIVVQDTTNGTLYTKSIQYIDTTGKSIGKIVYWAGGHFGLETIPTGDSGIIAGLGLLKSISGTNRTLKADTSYLVTQGTTQVTTGAKTWGGNAIFNGTFAASSTVKLSGLSYGDPTTGKVDVLTQDSTTGFVQRVPFQSLDTTGVANNYAPLWSTNHFIVGKVVRPSDTASMLATYLLGSGTANQIAYFSGSRLITSSSSLIFDGTNFYGGTSSSASNGSIAFGATDTASGGTSVSFGSNNKSKGLRSFTAGAGNSISSSSGYAFAVGNGNTITGDQSAVFGGGNAITATFGFSAGNNNYSNGLNAITLGSVDSVNSSFGTALGDSNSITTPGTASTVLGQRNISNNKYQLIVGIFNDTTNHAGLFEVAHGTSSTRKNYFTIDTTGKITANGISYGSPSTGKIDFVTQDTTTGVIQRVPGQFIDTTGLTDGALVQWQASGSKFVTVPQTNSSYTPTISNTTNVASSSAGVCYYTRTNNQVHVWGRVSVTATANTTATNFNVSLPIASDLTTSDDLSGHFSNNSVAMLTQGIIADAVNNKATFSYTSINTGSEYLPFSFDYVIK